MSKIEWTDLTWNPTAGCSRVSDGCDNCYAIAETHRLGHYKSHAGKYGGLTRRRKDGRLDFNGVVRLWEPHLESPLTVRKPQVWFVNSMSDVFHKGLDLEDVKRVFDVMRRAHWHAFQVLTKRPDYAADVADQLPWPPNVMMGTSVEDDRVLERIDHLRRIPAYNRFLSCEPLIGPLGDIDLTGISWVIVGGESGSPKYVRRMDVDWARDLRDRSKAAGAAFNFKQYGRLVNNPDPADPTAKENGGEAKGGRTLDGKLWDELPSVPGFSHPDMVGVTPPKPLTDGEWDAVAPLLPGRDGVAGGRGRDNRLFIEGVRWIAYSGLAWRHLPKLHGSWNTYAVRVKRWHEGGHWPAILAALQDPVMDRYIAEYDANAGRKRLKRKRKADAVLMTTTAGRQSDAQPPAPEPQTARPKSLQQIASEWAGIRFAPPPRPGRRRRGT